MKQKALASVNAHQGNNGLYITDFGYCPFIRRHSIEAIIDSEGVLFQENTHGRIDERRIIPKSWLPRQAWDVISKPVARELNRRIKDNSDLRGCKAACWNEGKNEIDLNLGRELLVLTWALEHTPASRLKAVLQAWLELNDVDRFYFYRLLNIGRCGTLDAAGSCMRRGLAMLLRGNEMPVAYMADLIAA